MKSVKKELKLLTSSLIRRLHIDLIHSSDDIDLATHDNRESAIDNPRPSSSRQWIAHPKTLRLSTRPRPPMNSDGSRSRSFTRISKSCNMPSIVFSNRYSIEIITERIVNDSLVPLFRKLHPDTDGWDLSLINLCATGISYCATDDKNGAGRDIGNMFKNQHDLLKEWKFEDVDVAPSSGDADQRNAGTTDDPSKIFEIIANDYQVDHLEGSEDQHIASQESYLDDSSWADEEDASRLNEVCHVCRAYMPAFAMVAHQRFHALQD